MGDRKSFFSERVSRRCNGQPGRAGVTSLEVLRSHGGVALMWLSGHGGSGLEFGLDGPRSLFQP